MLRNVRWLMLCLLCVLAACTHQEPGKASEESDPKPKSESTPSAPPAPSTRPPSAEPPGEKPVPPGAPHAAGEQAHGSPSAVERGCVLVRERVLSTDAERVLLAASPEGLLAVDVRGGKNLTLYRGSSLAGLERVASRTLDAPVSRAALHSDASGVRLALVDERGQVQVLSIDAAGFGSPQQLATGADRRFAPALASLGAAQLVAFVRAVGEGMHTFVAVVRGSKVTLHDVTPEGHGAAAPTFVAGAAEPTLVMLDARAGVSPLLELGFDGQGHPGPVTVRTPVSQPYAPPLLRAVELPDGEVEVAFTAVGKLAATAIGRVPLRRAVQPLALLPSRGYGELAFSALRGPRRAAFAYEAPRTSEPSSTRSVEVVLLDDQGQGPVLSLDGGEDARGPVLALYAGSLWLGYTRAGKAVVAALRCDLD